MRYRLITIACILASFILVESFAQKAPVDKYGGMSIEYISSMGEKNRCEFWWPNTAGIDEEYEKRFGAFPFFMIWDDVDDSVKVAFEIVFRRKSNPDIRYNAPKPHYPLDMTWGQARQYFFWRLKNIKTDEVSFHAVTQGDPDQRVAWANSPYNWYMKLYFDARDLPVPNDGSAYEVSLELYNEEPKDASEKPLYESPHFPVVRTVRTTPLDTLQWATYENLLWDDKELNQRLLRHFPNHTQILVNLVEFFYNERNADSLKYYAQRYIKVLEDQSDPHYPTVYPNGQPATKPRSIAHSHYDDIQGILLEVTGDTLDFGPRKVQPLGPPFDSVDIIE